MRVEGLYRWMSRAVIRWLRKLHRWNWRNVRHHHTGPNGRCVRPSADGIELFNLASVRISRYRHRGNTIPCRRRLKNDPVSTGEF